MTRFNLSQWAVSNKSIVVFLMLLCAVAGLGAYEQLGRQEDPDFSVQTMVVQVAWPGATAIDTLKQVTDRLEKKLEETPNLDYLKSYTKPGQATVFVYLKESTPKSKIEDIWYQVRKKVSDIQATFPKGVVGPFFNDEFGDVFGIVYGITYDGFSPREARDFAEIARAEFLRAPDVGKVEIFGDQDEKIYLDFSPQKLANLKLSLDEVLAAIAQQNAVVPSGVINTQRENVLVDVTGALLTPHGHRQPQPFGERSVLQIDRHRRGSSRLCRSAHQDVPRQWQARDRHRRQHALGRQQSHLRRRPPCGRRPSDATLAGRHRAQARLRSARGRARGHRRVHQGTCRGDRHCPHRELPEPRAQGRAGRCPVDTARARHRLPGHEGHGHQPAAHLAWRAHHRARPSGRRCHDHHRDDDLEDRGGHGEAEGGDLRLYLDRLSHADRNADHHFRLSADRLCRQQHRPILLLAVRRHCLGARRIVVRRRHLRAGDRACSAAVAHEGAHRRARPLHARLRAGARA